MKCLSCDNELNTVTRWGVEIAECSQCPGIWLDQGKLDEIIRRILTHSPHGCLEEVPV